MCLNVFEVVSSPKIKEKLFDQFYFRTTKQSKRSKSFYAERSYVPRKRNTNKEKEGQQLMLKSFSNMLLTLFTCSMPHNNMLIHSLVWCSHFSVLIKVCQWFNKGQQAMIDYKQISSLSMEIFCLLLTKEIYLTYIRVFALFAIFGGTLSRW